jgi:hypothetical protein
MSFLGKLVYLSLFPGAAFLVLAGSLAGAIAEWVRGTEKGGAEGANRFSELWRPFTGGRDGEDPAHTLTWIVPPIRLLSVAWVSCILFGFLEGDTVLVFALLVAWAASDLLLSRVYGDGEAEDRQAHKATAALGWALVLATVLAAISLRTGEVELSRIIHWQADNGMLVASVSGAGSLTTAGIDLAFLAALLAAISMMGLEPFGRGWSAGRGESPGIPGPALAAMRASEMAMLVTAPLLLVALFLAGPAGNWYESLFWALKVIAILAATALACRAAAGWRARALEPYLAGAAAVLALAGLALVWAGV